MNALWRAEAKVQLTLWFAVVSRPAADQAKRQQPRHLQAALLRRHRLGWVQDHRKNRGHAYLKLLSSDEKFSTDGRALRIPKLRVIAGDRG